MGIIGWLILCLGGLGAVYGSDCLQATAMCSRLWVKMEPHRNLLESEQELNSWCRKQSLFFKCLEDIFLVVYGNYSNFPMNMLVSKMFTEDLCLEGSKSRKRYLENAACINKLDLDYCTMPEYLDIVTPDSSVPPTKCSQSERTISCIATTILSRCGLDAGRVYRLLLKVTKYGEVCGMESSEETTCVEVGNSDKSEIYCGLYSRFGTIPEQPSELDSLEERESNFMSEESGISGTMNYALDYMDSSESGVSSTISSSGSSEVVRSTDEYRKKPIITEHFKGLLFYNYSDEEFAFYWRQPGSFPISRANCEHTVDSNKKGVMFGCHLYYEHEEPECVSPADEEENITPELIRDIDFTIPEDSTVTISDKPDWTSALRDYKRHRLSWEFFFNVKVVTEDRNIIKTNKDLVFESPNPKACLKELRMYDILNDNYVDWWQCPNLFSDDLRNDILTFLFPNRTRDTDCFIVSSANENYTDGGFHTYIHFFEPLFHGFEKVVCEKVNECHPRGRGVYRCSLERRGLEGCDSCCAQFPYDSDLCPLSRRIRSTKPEDGKEHSDIYSPSGEGSLALEELPGEEATFVVNDEAKTSDVELTNFMTGVVDDNEDLIAVDLSKLPVNPDNYFPSDANLVFLRRSSDDNAENSIVAEPEDIFSVSEEETLYDNLLKSELRLLNNNVFVLQAVTSVGDTEEVQEVI